MENTHIIVSAGNAEALYVVTADGQGEYSSNDTDINPLAADGCWPEPPAEFIREAQEIALTSVDRWSQVYKSLKKKAIDKAHG